MAQCKVHPVEPNVVVRVVRAMAPLPDAVDTEVARIWEHAQRRMEGRLFNGRVFSADVITPRLMCGHWTEYRRIVAQMEDHTLFRVIGVRPLAVGGVIVGPDGVVFGRRPVGAIYQAGEWQLPPAGSVDPGAERADGTVDVVAQLLAELTEELGIAADAVSDPQPLCIVEHAGSHVLDFGIGLRTTLDAQAIHTAHATSGNGEYAPVQVVPIAALPDFLAQAGPLLNHQAPVFLRRLGLINR